MLLRDAHRHDLARNGDADRVIRVKRLVLHLKEPQMEPLGYLRKTAPLRWRRARAAAATGTRAP
ncbi:MAG: hypothetical protein B7Z66_01690 [Chromatiales bacterium 21-64-14]|nr:MAG: hypothetical protein B7Z66_01690 [Chromatiales bacterium 21-64-14]